MTPALSMLVAVLIPAVAALPIALSGRFPNLREAFTLIAALLLLLTVLTLVPQALAGDNPALELWQMLPGLGFAFRLEPLGMLFACVASFLWLINSIYSIGYMRGNSEHKQTSFYVCFAIALSSTVGLAFSGNLLTLFVFYEILTLSTYPLVVHKGDDDARAAGRTYIGVLMGTSIGLLMPAIIGTWLISGTLAFRPGGIIPPETGPLIVTVLFAAYIYGTGKAALMPFHRWLPAAMVAPTPVSALLHAVAVVKAGVFTVIKVSVYTFGLDVLSGSGATQWVIYVSGFTILAASVIALQQDNLKRRLAYSTVSQLSYFIMATMILAPLSVIGAALHIVAHAFGKITLFFAAGSIYTAAHENQISRLHGIGRRMPWTMGAFAIGSLSMIGLPPTIGFLSKWYMLAGAMAAEQVFAVAVLIISTVLNAAYFLPIVYNAFFRPLSAEAAAHPHGEAPLAIVIALTTTALMTVLLFCFPHLPIALATQMLGGVE